MIIEILATWTLKLRYPKPFDAYLDAPRLHGPFGKLRSPGAAGSAVAGSLPSRRPPKKNGTLSRFPESGWLFWGS